MPCAEDGYDLHMENSDPVSEIKIFLSDPNLREKLTEAIKTQNNLMRKASDILNQD